MVNSIKKGKNGEREVAKLLTKITNVNWRRVPSSGALFTSQQAKKFKGDVYTDSPLFENVVVEVKNTKKGLTVSDMFNKKSCLYKWLDQLEKETGQHDTGVLFFKDKGKWFFLFGKVNVGGLEFVRILQKNGSHKFGIWKLNVRL